MINISIEYSELSVNLHLHFQQNELRKSNMDSNFESGKTIIFHDTYSLDTDKIEQIEHFELKNYIDMHQTSQIHWYSFSIEFANTT